MDSLVSVYKSLFVAKHSHPYYKLDGKGWLPAPNWQTSYIQDSEIEEHLLGKKLLGQKFDNLLFSNFFVLDCDFRELKLHRTKDWLPKIKELIDNINLPYFCCTSSESYNLHVYFWCKESPIDYINTTIRDLAERHEVIIDKPPYRIELFCGGRKTLRLPLGKGSKPLNKDFSINNKPLTAILSNLYDSVYRTRSLPKLENSLISSPKFYTSYRVTNPSTSKLTLESLLNYGLTSPGTLNNAIQILVRYGHSKKYTQQETQNFIINWLDQFDNNRAYSKDLRRKHNYVIKKVELATSLWYKRCSNLFILSGEGSLYSLTEEFCSYIFSEFKSYKLQKKVYQLLSLIIYKARVNPIFSLSKREIFSFGFHDHNYRFVIDQLCNDGVITLIKRGNNWNKSINIYSLNRKIINSAVYTSYTSYIDDKKLYKWYSKKEKEIILKDKDAILTPKD